MGRRKILYLDDDPHMRSFMAHALEHSYDIETADSPARALNMLQEKSFDLAIFDFNFKESKLNGVSTATAIEKLGLHIPVGILTVYAKEELDEVTLEMLMGLKNIVFYEMKPIGHAALEKLIETALHKKQPGQPASL